MKTIISKISKTNVNNTKVQNDSIAIEKPLEIRLGHDENKFQTLAITLCTPADIKDLVFGNLFTENIITNKDDIKNIDIFNNELGLIAEVTLCKSINFKEHLNKRHGMIHASCGVCGKTNIDDLLTFNYPKKNTTTADIDTKIIFSLPEKLKLHQQGFAKTGGLHASALFTTNGELQLVREDIGRHNALDKLIGSSLQKNKILQLNNHIVLLSGRISFELVHKALIAGTSTLCAIGAPSSLSIEIAKSNNLNLIGFIKEKNFNNYSVCK